MINENISNLESEAGVIATVLAHPDYVFYSDQLTPHHFTESENGYIYYAVSELAKRGVNNIDTYNVINFLDSKEATRNKVDKKALTDFMEIGSVIVRDSIEEYLVLVDNVLDAAFRRSTIEKLKECERLCYNGDEEDIQQKIYSTLDSVMTEFSATNEIPQFKDVIDTYWDEIVSRQEGEHAGIAFKFPELNKYCTIEPGELIIFGGYAKIGKSMMMLNVCVDLLKKNKAVFYIDSELNSVLFTCRLISHITGIEFQRVKSGHYTPQEAIKINDARNWLKTRKLTHLYMPIFDDGTIYVAAKKVMHTQGLDVIIVDYFKDSGDGDAFSNSQSLGAAVDLIKNKICGAYKICGIGAAQTTATGSIAGSAKIGRNASTFISLQAKTPEEMETDGKECGNRKLVVKLNRNGAQMSDGEYIDLMFDGDRALYEEAKQHVVESPY